MDDEARLCICCGKNPVTWPRVCDDCTDHKAQAELANHYGVECYEHPVTGELILITGMECKTCGMIYDGGSFCTYCGDRNPTGDSEEDFELMLDDEYLDFETEEAALQGLALDAPSSPFIQGVLCTLRLS